MPSRDSDPKYKAWAYQVKALFDFTCVLCRKTGGHLESHHIVRWSDNPRLRYALSNGVCLCVDCHRHVTGNEEQYERQFKRINNAKLSDWNRRNIRYNKRKKRKKNTRLNKIKRKKGKKKFRKPRRL